MCVYDDHIYKNDSNNNLKINVSDKYNTRSVSKLKLNVSWSNVSWSNLSYIIQKPKK
jgi:hypothetical protein